MTFEELQQLRRSKWRLSGEPVRTLEDARAFLDDVGMCLMYPARPAVLLPTLVGAVVGEDVPLPSARQAFADPRAQQAVELARRLAHQRLLFESNLFPDNTLLIASGVFPYFHALVAEHTPQAAAGNLSRLAQLAWNVFQKEGPIAETQLAERLGAEPSAAAVQRALGELWMRLRIVPAGEDAKQGRLWDSPQRWAPKLLREAAQISLPAAISGLISQYLATVVAAELGEIDEFFAHLAPRSKVKESVNALLAAREFSFLPVGHKSLVQLTPARTPYVRRERTPPAVVTAAPAVPRRALPARAAAFRGQRPGQRGDRRGRSPRRGAPPRTKRP